MSTLYSIYRYTGTGSAQVLPVPPYIAKDHIKVWVAGVEVAPSEWVTAQSVRLTAAPGALIVIQRVTSVGARLVDYQGSVPLTESDLDLDSLQAFYLAQEARDIFEDLAALAAGPLDTALAAAVAANASASAAAGSAVDSAASVGTLTGLLADSASPANGPGKVAWARLNYAAGTLGYRELVSGGVNLLDFVVPASNSESVRTGTIAVDTAWASAMTACYLRGNATLHVPHGSYRVDGLLSVTQGVLVDCEGSQGSTDSYGTVFRHYNTGSCFRFDGSGTAFAGTGGGLRNCLIIKKAGYSGGHAVEIVATADSQRPGEMRLENVLAYGESTGRWARGLVIDGSACNTPGARGVRTVHVVKCRFADVTVAGETVLLKQVTHFYSHGLAVDQGSGVAAGVKLQGINDGVYMNSSGIGGDLLIVANDASNSTNNFHFDGKISATFVNNDTQLDGTLRATIGSTVVLVNKSAALKCSTNINPAWLLTMSSTAVDVTGDGTVASVPWNSELLDQGNNFAVPTTTFNCLCAGVYKLEFCVAIGGMSAAHTRSDVSILRTGSATTEFVSVANPGPQLASGGNYSDQVATTIRLAHGDVVSCRVMVSGSTKVADIVGAGTVYTWFSGSLVG